MNTREKEILSFIINYHLEEGSAVGSRSLVKKYNIEYSPATVRNIMADLEDEGYIIKSHTSSGRAPTAKGYKFFVNSLLKIKSLPKDELKKIKSLSFENNILSEGTQLLSEMTNYTSFALEPSILKEKLKKIELVYINNYSFLAVIVTDGRVNTKRIILNRSIKEDDLKNLSEYFNRIFRDQVLENIKIDENNLPFKNELVVLQNLISQIESELHFYGKESIINHLVANNNFDLDTYKMFQVKKDMRHFLESLVDKGLDKNKINIVLGDDLGSDKLKDFSFVFSTYDKAGSKGMLGVIGPKRMEYGKVASIVSNLSDHINFRGVNEEEKDV
jgi:heat-inducible transcriptional repressor